MCPCVSGCICVYVCVPLCMYIIKWALVSKKCCSNGIPWILNLSHEAPFLTWCLSSLTCYCEKTTWHSSLREKGFIWYISGLQSVTVGKPRWKELEAAGPITSSVMSYPQCHTLPTVLCHIPVSQYVPCPEHTLSLLLQFRILCLGNIDAHSGRVFSPQCNQDNHSQSCPQAHII